MLITKKIQIAVNLLKSLETNTSHIEGESIGYVYAIGNKLVKGGILKSKKGPNGHYYITKNIVTLGDLAVALKDVDLNTELGILTKEALDTIIVARMEE